METLDRNYVNIEDEMRRSYLDYAMSVIIGRALPDVRDGFKPVHRRVLWAMHELGNQYNKAYKKSARIVGDVIGKYHPHGDSAVYETIVRMAQDFSMRYPLVDGQGNFGSVDGDAAAAMRYTEARMSKITTEVLADIEKETVNFQPNYDESLSEPSVLPTRVPTLLLNGADGIAVGMATKIPPHNLSEVVEATIALIRKPSLKDEELLKIVPGPDFPTGGFIYGREGIRQAYLTGRGIIQMRARAGIDRIGRGSTERDAIIITEIPYQLNKARLIERIAELVGEKKIDGIADLRDESSRDGMRIVVELKRDAVPQIVLNKLYKLTPMQSTFGVINLAIVQGQPRVLSLRQMLEHFVEFRREVVRRRTEYELRKARARAHILEGLNKAIGELDYIIFIIRNAKSVDEARALLMGHTDELTVKQVGNWKGIPSNLDDMPDEYNLKFLRKLVKRLDFSEQQAQAILDLQLRRLSALERQKIIDEYEQIIKLIAELEDILANESSLRRVIVKELEDVRKDFGDARRTQIIDEGVELSVEDMIADEDVAITVTKNGYVKRTPVTTYQRQGRGGKGRSGAGTGKNDDWVEHLFIASTHSYLMIFTDDGQVYKLKVHQIPDAMPSARGKAIVNLINISSARRLAGVIPVREFSEGRYVVMVTKNGVIKKTELSEFQNIRSNGINAVNVDEGDELLDVVLTDGTKRIFIATHDGLAIRFDESDVRPMGRAARGVRGVDLRKGDYVVSVAAVSADDTEKMLSISECGFGKQTPITTYRLQSRGGKGVINMKTTEKTGKVVAVFPVEEESEMMIITKNGKLIRIEAGEIRKTGRSAQGVRLMKTDGSDKVTSASLLGLALGVEEGGGGDLVAAVGLHQADALGRAAGLADVAGVDADELAALGDDHHLALLL
ncbi:MAG TPA: DNA gyrase subunit A, partial [Pyrinomonadaceae bacterium]|nr:DNA gyrase subunit A [Pyrinomonadaceae bacterium]